MNNKVKVLGVAVVCLIVFLFSACGSKADAGYDTLAPAYVGGEESAMAVPAYASDDYVAADMDGASSAPKAATGDADGSLPITLPQDNRKVILNADVSIESTKFEDTLTVLQPSIAGADGYISASSTSGRKESVSRWATITARIPADKYPAFMEGLSSAGTVTDRREYSEDVTAQYVDVEARLNSLKAQEKRLLELTEQAESLEDVVTLQEHLSNIQYEIESYTAQRRSLENLTSYSTVTLSIAEVSTLTTTNTESTLGSNFLEGWRSIGRFFVGLGYFLALAFPWLLFIALIVVLIVFLTRRSRRKRKNSAPAYFQPQPAPTYPQAPQQPNPQQDSNAPQPNPQPSDDDKVS